ncbi:MAG: glycoside hydrolase family 97 protein [Gammaproteobacteria bacterium]|nr:glycoside hydrolase family 97 protein [Gammaproteobacteria bacterium]MBU2059893.1 glycoside hydrolase family 97 protein [Gammaproteobacteria bacterium]MBU2175852.1 glycoside hydrolase family 97 protein [Gammaproteobacteria bacterium]MBU2247675.1 glycoside hydrolase family 97 protein [Gammaproteobacteria bacterium]MBU2345982.1 glycoside hydrolase family 97 protein [Gammaproteobacteria bacterium]
MKWIPLFILTTLLSLQTIAEEPTSGQSWLLKSPDQQITLSLILSDKSLSYSVNYKTKAVIKPSALGFAFKDQPQLQANLKALKVQNRSHNDSWQPVWGQRATIVDHYNEISLALTEQGANARQMQLVFRAYNDGVAFRYLLPKQPHLNKVVISDELTEFAFARNFSTWWIQAYQDQRFEYQYLNSALSSVNVAHTPLTLLDQGIAVSVHEAALVDYASMTLRNITDNHIRLKADLVPWANGDKVYTQTPFQTPWRTIQIADSEVALLNSDLILNLNEPAAKDTDVSYIKPGKYIGIWWEMHIGEKDWSPGPKQGATTERAMQYIDFASKHKIDAVLIEGWNKGWEGDWWQRSPTFNFTEAVQGFDIEKVNNYAKSKGVTLTGHHETAAGIQYYEKQMEAAFAYYQKLGIPSVKMGYVGTRVDQKEWHHGQYMVNHFQRVTETAAKHQVMVNAHETVKDTGLSRTYPNLMTRESVRGMEYNGGSPDTGNLPNHTVIIPFTRGLSGPIDFTPGIFNFDYQKHRPDNRVPSTLANQLALYVTLYSPLQMAADLPENYQGHPAFAFIDAVPTDWRQSIALQGKIGQYLVIARQDKHSDNWYLGATSNEEARVLEQPLSFLKAGTRYQVIAYTDAADANWETNPEAYEIKRSEVTAKDKISLILQAGGGAAIEFIPLK